MSLQLKRSPIFRSSIAQIQRTLGPSMWESLAILLI
jgi:hypothetical protein